MGSPFIVLSIRVVRLRSNYSYTRCCLSIRVVNPGLTLDIWYPILPLHIKGHPFYNVKYKGSLSILILGGVLVEG